LDSLKKPSPKERGERSLVEKKEEVKPEKTEASWKKTKKLLNEPAVKNQPKKKKVD